MTLVVLLAWAQTGPAAATMTKQPASAKGSSQSSGKKTVHSRPPAAAKKSTAKASPAKASVSKASSPASKTPSMAGKPSMAKKPASRANKPGTSAKKSVTTAKKATSTARKPSTRRAATSSRRRSASSRSRRAATYSYRAGQQKPAKDRYLEIERALEQRGYLTAEQVDGNWGASSTEALKKFQQDQNLRSDGKIDSLSLIALGLGPKRDGGGAPKSSQ